MPSLNQLQFSAGHYSATQLHAEHGLILSNLGAQVPQTSLHTHGKRKKLTTTLDLSISSFSAYNVLDRFINLLLSSVPDIGSFAVKRQTIGSTYSFKLASYFETADTASLVSERLLIKRNIFIPLAIQVSLKNHSSPVLSETYLYMLRLPLKFHKHKL